MDFFRILYPIILGFYFSGIAIIIISIIIWKNEKVIEILEKIFTCYISPYIGISSTGIKNISRTTKTRPKQTQVENISFNLEEEIKTDEVFISDSGITYSPARINNYSIIKKVANAFRFLSIVIIIIGVIVSLLSFINFYNTSLLLGATAFLVVLSTFGSISLLFIFNAQLIYVFLDIEANTRQTAKILERFLRMSPAINSDPLM